jgi:N-acetylneuraminic acid mutarotase
MDNAAGYDPGTGDVYSFGGSDGLRAEAAGYRYDPSTQQWAPVASLPRPLDEPAGAFLDGKMYVIGGWDTAANPVSSVYAYNPVLGSWSQAASLPTAVSAAAATVLDGQLYVIGGCTTATCDPSVSTVFRYDPVRGSWTQLADYPAPVAFLACAGVSEEIVCAGGYDALSGNLSNSVYIYNPRTNSWSQGADMPSYTWGMAYSGSGNLLLVAGGVISPDPSPADGAVTGQAYQYDLTSNTWTALLDANYPEYRGGGACGFYKIGGSNGNVLDPPLSSAELLPGFSQCGQTKVSWLSLSHTTFAVQPGQSVTVAVTMHPSAGTRPGTYTAYLPVSTNSPYPVAPVTVSMRVAR